MPSSRSEYYHVWFQISKVLRHALDHYLFVSQIKNCRDPCKYVALFSAVFRCCLTNMFLYGLFQVFALFEGHRANKVIAVWTHNWTLCINRQRCNKIYQTENDISIYPLLPKKSIFVYSFYWSSVSLASLLADASHSSRIYWSRTARHWELKP